VDDVQQIFDPGVSMRAVWITRAGGPEVLAVRHSADPQPDRGEVRIAVRAAGLNFAEVMARQGLYPDAPKPPCVVGYEVSGVVDALGAGVTGLAVGQRVLALVRFGGHADTVCAPAERVLPMPDDLSFTDGAALPVNYLTAELHGYAGPPPSLMIEEPGRRRRSTQSRIARKTYRLRLKK
jgi:NADPH:quinone reductase-like Zn-dependent oxidoreductase